MDTIDDMTMALIRVVAEAAFYDETVERPNFTGAQLIKRLDLRRYRKEPRRGDSVRIKAIYSAARWLTRTNRLIQD